MIISQVIKKLEEIKQAEGDIEVTCWPYDGQPNVHELNTIKTVKQTDRKFVELDSE